MTKNWIGIIIQIINNMEKNEKQKKKITPPYLSVSKIEETFRLIANRNFKTIDNSVFEGYGYGVADALLAVNMLRFLSLIDDEGNPTSLIEKVRLQGDARKKEFEEIVRKAYENLFEIVSAPQNLPIQELTNEFLTQYKLSMRIAKSAVPAFIKLCEYAGLKEEGSIVGRKRTPKAGENKDKNNVTGADKKTLKSKTFATSTGTHLYPVVKEKMTISVPEDWYLLSERDDTLNEKWRAVVKAAHLYAESMSNQEDKTNEKAES